MPGANELPYFIKVEFNEQGQFRRFTESVDSAALDAERSFQRSMDSIVRASQEGSRAAQGAFNLDFNVSGQRASAEAAELQAIKLRAAAQAAQELEREGAQLGRSTAVTVAGFQTAAREAEELAREERELADAMEQVQARAGAQIPSLRQLTAADQAAQRSVRSSRVAYIQAGQQLTDMSVQMQSGTRATTIFAQQVPQLAFALSYLEKSTDPAQAKLGRFARFLSGPWGAAIFIGTSLLGGLIEKLLEAAPALEAAEAGSDGLASAQSALGQIFDLTSGRIESQNELLRLNARLMAVTLRAEAAQEQIASRQYLGGGRNQSFLGTAASFFNRGGGGNPFERARTPPLARGVIDRLESGEITAEQALTEIGALPSNAFQGTGASQAEVLQGIVNRISAPLKEQTADAIDRSLSSGTLDPSFLRNDRTGGGSDRSGSSAASRLSEFGDDAADRIARLNDQFSNTPGLVARANQAMRQLDDLLEDIRERRPPDFETLITQAEALRPIIEDSINQPYRDLIESQATQRRIGAEILSQGEEAGALLRVRIQLEEQMGRELLPAELAAIEDNLAAEREQNQLLEERARLIDGQIKQLTGVRSILVDIAANPADIGNSIGNLISQFQGFSAETLIESMFGSTFRDLEERFRQRTPLEIANDNAAEAIDDTTVSVNDFRSAIEGATSALGSGSGSVPGVSGLSKSLGKIVDGTKQAAEVLEAPGVPISVTGQRPPASATAAGYPSPRELYNEIGRSIGEELGPLGREIGSQLGNALQGAGYGTLAGGLVLGQSGSSTGSGIGGALGGVFGEEVLSDLLGKSLGQFAGPLGSIAGGLIGGLVGGALKSTPRASATIGFSSPGNLDILSLAGKNSRKAQATGAAGGVIEGLQAIIAELGGELSGPISVSIGVRDDNFRVDTTGSGITKTKKGAVDFGQDQAAAVAFAIQDAIRDGVITGLRQGALNLLRGDGDIDQQVNKASQFQGVFEQLEEATDPVGYAIRKLNEEFTDLRKIFDEAGASAEEYADLEELYQLRRKEVFEKVTEQITGALSALLDDLTVNNDALSLRSRLSLALGDLNPLLSGIEAGEKVDYDAFAEAARIALDIQREISGSQQDYFSLLGRVTDATKRALSEQENIISIAEGTASPFSGATDPASSSSVAPIVDALDLLGDRIVTALNDNFGSFAGGSTNPSSAVSQFANRLNF